MTDINGVKKVVLAYSGGLDTSVIIPWLKENYGCEVIACTVNLGQPEDFDAIHEKALKSGASVAETLDVRKEFIEEYAYNVLKADGIYEGKYLLGTSFARPLIGKCLVDMAKKYGADAICHGATGKGNDQVRFELTIKALAPHMKIIAPWRIWDMKSREDEMKYAEEHGVPIDKYDEKQSEEEKAARQKAVQDATRYATEVPFKTMKQCYECMSVAKAMAEIGNPNSVTDAGVGALAARAGVMGAFLNVKINAAGLEDKEFAAQIIREGEAIVEKANELEAEILKIVNSKI